MSRRHLLAALGALALSWSSPAALAANNTDLQVRLQSAMQSHIDRTAVNGIYPSVDLRNGQIRQFHPAAGHPMVLRLGENYVLCTDFRDASGKPVNVDFYLSPKGKGFSVFQVEFANRAPLQALMQAGVARMLD